AKLGAIVSAVFALSLAPFWYHGQLGALAGRLFPFGRGLSHAYWAPNFWALYNGADLALAKLAAILNLTTTGAGSRLTSVLRHQSSHQVLPSISPTLSLMRVIVSITVTFSPFLQPLG